MGRLHACLILIVAALAASLLIVAPAADAAPAHRATMSDSQFYAQPTDLSRYRPGDIIRTREVVVRTLQLLPMRVNAWQVLYRTTDGEGRPAVTAATLLARAGTRPTELLSHQVAIDSVAPDCQPSRGLINNTPIDFSARGGPITLTMGGVESLFIANELSSGYGVVIPDHGGLRADFLVNALHAQTTLDGIRAALKFPEWHLNARTPVGLWGYSGGGMATSLAAEYQPTYAPELNVRGAVLGSPFRDVAAGLRKVEGSPTSGLIPMGLASLIKYEPEKKEAFLRDVSPWGRAKVEAALHQCTPEAVVEGLWLDYTRFFTAPIDVVLNRPVFRDALDRRGMTGLKPTAPLYVFSAVDDEVITSRSVDRLVRSYCAGDASVTYRRAQFPPKLIPQLNSPHGATMVLGAPASFEWLDRRMSSSAVPTRRCDVKTLPTTALEPEALGRFPGVIRSALESMLGLPLSAAN
ncbi:lipase family protein [Gordonia sp. HY285]|uniref:lipase family protein n=1 Tax=Gordonia liuliyuniae TaxID=2911517 RepID=UPI001F3A89B3|nr:lipase family protein [Gordonia liuliyuniae]MCF8609066.1 lipase family protein [Gordonia liuliyuniae]